MNDPFQVVLAPNSFKNSLSSSEAAIAIQEGLDASSLNAECILLPVADGGDHTLQVLVDHFKGSFIAHGPVKDTLGRPASSRYGIIDIDKQSVAVVELAEASGIRNLEKNELNVMRADTFGTGQVMLHAIRGGARKILLGLGGSAGVDAGTGILRAFGFSFVKFNGEEIAPGGKELALLYDIKFPETPLPASFSLDVLCDVSNPLTGPDGAALVFGPQKGATPAQAEALAAGLENFAKVVYRVTGTDITSIPHGGAAGGAAAGLHALLGASLSSGAKKILELCRFHSACSGAHLVITGEGRLDHQSLQGKAPVIVANQASAAGVPVIALVGKVEPGLQPDVFKAVLPIGNGHRCEEEAHLHTRADLQRTARQLGNMIALFST
ncbi:MAG: glycerate kinase [Cyclobacteriaceae bacterium]